jgi:hypothetical protein
MATRSLSPIALTARDQVLSAMDHDARARVRCACLELLVVNTRGFASDDPGICACAAAVFEGVLAALRELRASVVVSAMDAVVDAAMKRNGTIAVPMAELVCAAVRVIDREPTTTSYDLGAAIEGALHACDRLPGADRETVIRFLRETLPSVPHDRAAGFLA